MAERFSLDDREKGESLERSEAVGYDALVAASTDVSGDHLETLMGFYGQMREISVQRQTMYSKLFEKHDGLRIKT